MKRISYYFVILVFFLACSRSRITPSVSDDANLKNTLPISQTTMNTMEGIYKLTGGNEKLGSRFVCKVSKNRVSFFSDKDGIFIILKYGYKASDGSIQFSGFWRKSEFREQGTIYFALSSTEGADNLFKGIVSNLKLKGGFSENSIEIQYDHSFTNYASTNPFLVFAHHGVQSFADPPFAENSINAVLNCEAYGVNGLEFDIRMTSDYVPICIHDADINIRLTQKGPLTGTWDQYPFGLISRHVRLIDGQKVPSLEEALNVFIDSTSMTYFWMDVKGNTDIFKYLEPVVRKAYTRALSKNRQVVIFAGLPSDEVIAELKKQTTYNSINANYPYSSPLPILAEQSLEKVFDNSGQFYGPRYTEGLLLNDVETAHASNIKVISWTLNSKAIINDYLKNGKFDGFITDYPAYLVYSFYTLY